MTSPADIAGQITLWTSVARQLAELTKSATELSAKRVSKETAAALADNLIELRSTILSLQAEHLALTREKANLEEIISKHDIWEEEKKAYFLKNIQNGLTVYAPRPIPDSIDAPHWLCPGCFSKKQKGIMVMVSLPVMAVREYRCAICQLQIKTHVTPGGQ